MVIMAHTTTTMHRLHARESFAIVSGGDHNHIGCIVTVSAEHIAHATV